MSLDELPIELLHGIIRLVDPIGLISLSQSNSHFRRVVSPRKHHFAERLLALEAVPEYGGVAPIYHSRTSTLTPDCDDDSWKAMRWACTDCLRLLPHQSFDNHSLLALAYRKPTADSPAADLTTTWEPSLLGKPWGSFSKKASSAQERSLRKCYGIALTWSRSTPPGHIPPRLLEHEEDWFTSLAAGESGTVDALQLIEKLDQHALSYERDHCGYKRRLRMCNECRYQRGRLKHEPWGQGMALGTAKVPIMPSRRIVFGSALDRFFPNISRVLQAKRPSFDPPLHRVYRTKARGDYWTLRMVRCPECSRWQEMREFRFCGTYPSWRPTLDEDCHAWDDDLVTEALIEKACCNKCFAKKHGPQELGAVLLACIKSLIDMELRSQSSLLLFGFTRLKNSSNHSPIESKQKLGELNRIIRGAIKAGQKYEVGKKEISIMKAAHKKVGPFLEQLSEKDQRLWSLDDDWFTTWLLYFYQAEEFWTWAKSCESELEENPLTLADWALSRDGAALY